MWYKNETRDFVYPVKEEFSREYNLHSYTQKTQIDNETIYLEKIQSSDLYFFSME